MTRTLLTAIFLTLFSQTAWAEQFEGIFSCSSGENNDRPITYLFNQNYMVRDSNQLAPFERLGIIEGKRVVYMGKKLNKIKYDKTINGLYNSIRFMSQRRLRGDSQLYPYEFDVREERNFLAATGFLRSQSISRLEFKKGLDRQNLG
jgi:hypothetical protein